MSHDGSNFGFSGSSGVSGLEVGGSGGPGGSGSCSGVDGTFNISVLLASCTCVSFLNLVLLSFLAQLFASK